MQTNGTESRGQWGSSLGFIMAAAGSAVGLGNIWRFPYLAGENGGGAFVFVYLCCVLLIGLPLLFNEVAIGRLTGKNPIGAMQAERPRSWWVINGIFCVAVCFFVLSYYGVIAGWTIGYIFSSLSDTPMDFETFAANPMYVIPLLGVFMVMTILIILGGISGGIEKAVKVLMPALLLILLVLVVRSVTLDGAQEGLEFYLIPDFSKINGDVVLIALGQAFFSLSVGWGLMVTYGSYLPKRTNLVSAGTWVAFADTFVAFLGGLLIFPAVFAFGKNPAEGPALVFKVLPEIFAQMPLGSIVGAFFFLLLMIAALTSSISMLEVPVSYLIDNKKWNRKKAAWIVGILAFVVGIPSALSYGAVPALSKGGIFGDQNFLGFMDNSFGTLGVIVISLLFTLFTGYAIVTSRVVDELGEGSNGWTKRMVIGVSLAQVWVFFIKVVCPLTIAVMIYFKYFHDTLVHYWYNLMG